MIPAQVIEFSRLISDYLAQILLKFSSKVDWIPCDRAFRVLRPGILCDFGLSGLFRDKKKKNG